ncbi:MAG TPA: XRE family transcriptional regulator [Ruminococcaceae bacterium]|jgi:transcriptional regulator with XRE-family HTH domain|nr:XRE family transcriptional regulator [Oscillospiraceae bacterium]
MATEFGKRLMALRKSENLTRDKLANELDMSVNTLRNYENGCREPGHKFVIKMAERFNVSTDYILGVSDEKRMKDHVAETEKQELSSDKKQLLKSYDSLNDEGQEFALEYMNGLTYNPKYKKCNSSKQLA